MYLEEGINESFVSQQRLNLEDNSLSYLLLCGLFEKNKLKGKSFLEHLVLKHYGSKTSCVKHCNYNCL